VQFNFSPKSGCHRFEQVVDVAALERNGGELLVDGADSLDVMGVTLQRLVRVLEVGQRRL
jgi:hypothetical protein